MKINRFVSGLAGLVLAACGQENNSGNNNNSYDGGYSDGGNVNECTLDSECGGDRYCDKTVTPYVCKAKQGNLPPVVIIEAKDKQGNVKTQFSVGEQVTYDFNKSYDPDCESKNKCGNSKGLHYCNVNNNFGGASTIYFQTFGSGTFSEGYGYPIGLIVTAKCFDIESALLPESKQPYGEGQIAIVIQ